MDESSYAAGPMPNVLLVPGAGKKLAFRSKRVDEALDPRVAETVAVIGAEFREKPSGPVLPFGDEAARRLVQKNEAQQIALIVAIQPDAKQTSGRTVPAACVPEAVEPVGRIRDGVDRGHERGRGVCFRFGRQSGVKTAGKLEQICPLGARES